MVKKKNNSVSKRSGKTILSQVITEMAKPRITASARALNGTAEGTNRASSSRTRRNKGNSESVMKHDADE